MREFLEICLTRQGYEVELAASGTHALTRFAADGPDLDLVVTDLTMPGCSGLEVLREAKKLPSRPSVIMITAFATTNTAVEAMKLGAYDYLVKPFKTDEFVLVIGRALGERALRSENRELKSQLLGIQRLDRLVAKSKKMQDIFELIRKVAPTRTNVLVCGESGTGKELVARALHTESDRANSPFLAINCGAIPEQLIESELFGHVRGAFTGAHADNQGLFRSSGNGTLFLDEIGELDNAVQVKLLRVLQERTVRPVGSSETFDIKCRVVAATNRNLEADIATGVFRQDLFFRLNVVRIDLPPLRARPDDIPVLASRFFRLYNEEQGGRLKRIAPQAFRRLLAYEYPGNVRELENLIERAVTLCSETEISEDYFPGSATAGPSVEAQQPLSDGFPEGGLDLDAQLARVERDVIRSAIERAGGSRRKAAALLRISLRSLRYRVQKLGMHDSFGSVDQ